MENTILIQGAQLVRDEGITPGDVLISGSRIAKIAPAGGITPGPDTAVIDGRNRILSPGFIDLHCHGGAGGDVNDGDPEAYRKMEEFHRSRGVTAFMPTLSVDPMPKLEKACAMVRALRQEDAGGGAEILGVHFESPYINPVYKGCQAAECILPFDEKAMHFIRQNSDIISRITLAPELDGVLEAIPELRQMGILVSGGHSNADAVMFRRAADRGMTMATHLYNAMSSVRKEGPYRIPGVLEAALTDDRIYTELIADGHHVPGELLQIAYRCKGPDRFMACSDASRAAGYSGSERVFICGQEAVIENGVGMLKDRSSLASSVVALDTMVRVLAEKAGLTPHLALRAVSYVPAKAAGIDNRKGRLAEGYDADLVLLDEKLNVCSVWCRGIKSGGK
ncbi:N-acetylglucosamine-6-phosphate deacetylase [Breznakiella homolactica]|uniref:N-acetylglucosamine-6-phosphate deacetylase n=1 Tax=Breznakiella homolactica TaxID=2798577 RepID=A0A7T7XMC7_9SPIR|nr:N-acetylglucosamine-6-phosphate deacetylase [Breznakiella homolactica]QQO08918.1 N-acetylglucosamine-6-phosphate deacetylase [Breznakiella homolactica]